VLLAQKAWGIEGRAALILKNPSCFNGFLDILSGLEEFIEK
jgi:hypothetical protein